MRLAAGFVGLVVAAGMVVSVPTPASADTGGGPLYLLSKARPYGLTAIYRTTASDAERHRRLPFPLPSQRMLGVLGVVPSPDGRHLAVAVADTRHPGSRHKSRQEVAVYVTDANGRHAHRLFARANGGAPPPNQVRFWDIDGLAWAPGSHRLYFSMQHVDRFTDDRIGVRLLVGPRHLLRSQVRLCQPSAGWQRPELSDHGPHERTCRSRSLRPRVVRRRGRACHGDVDDRLARPRHWRRRRPDLIASPPAFCASAIDHLAWSPDGTQIAFDQVWLPYGYAFLAGQVDLVAVDGSDGAAPRVVAANDQGSDHHSCSNSPPGGRRTASGTPDRGRSTARQTPAPPARCLICSPSRSPTPGSARRYRAPRHRRSARTWRPSAELSLRAAGTARKHRRTHSSADERMFATSEACDLACRGSRPRCRRSGTGTDLRRRRRSRSRAMRGP